ncbi:threonine synthase [Paenibacillus sp. yr247]|uniref:threonine synthase n=1 Tax=Paenibacillus sp. yr247 TaxID=1761880 RepID=UPI00088825DA|nr:threonine synthase [Paenibacillus sp. yr247]SDP27929.1 threonine synthase [Paenibacillus sp. yr247]
MDKCWLRCSKCFQKIDFDLIGRCICKGTLLVEYDLEKINLLFNKQILKKRSIASLWRYHEILPIRNFDSIVTLGEGWTPLVRLHSLEKKLSLKQIWIKREEQNPTGSFKARGFSVAVSLLSVRGIKKVTVPSNGNAASALSAYAGRAGMQAYVFLPQDCPPQIIEECKHYGAFTFLVDGMIHDAGKIIEEGKTEQGWFNAGTLQEPGRVEGKKTMGFEIAEQLNWKLPDVIVYPTGGGSGIIGIWKAFHELKALGFIRGCLPRLISVQEEGCQPIVDAMENASLPTKLSLHSATNPTGLRVPFPPDLDLVVSILKETNGAAIAVSKEEIRSAQQTLGSLGISSSPEGAATFAGLLRLHDKKAITEKETVVLFNTSHALKYMPWKPSDMAVIRNYSEFKSLI